MIILDHIQILPEVVISVILINLISVHSEVQDMNFYTFVQFSFNFLKKEIWNWSTE